MANESTTQRGVALEPSEKFALEREGTRPGPVFRPDVDIVERRDEFVVTADLPGVDEQHVDVRLENGVLSIDASLAQEAEPAWTPVYREYETGGYHREFALSDEIDGSRIAARMHEGVLELHLPKTEQHRPRRIQVQSG
jgi:HSP20 family protein